MFSRSQLLLVFFVFLFAILFSVATTFPHYSNVLASDSNDEEDDDDDDDEEDEEDEEEDDEDDDDDDDDEPLIPLTIRELQSMSFGTLVRVNPGAGTIRLSPTGSITQEKNYRAIELNQRISKFMIKGSNSIVINIELFPNSTSGTFVDNFDVRYRNISFINIGGNLPPPRTFGSIMKVGATLQLAPSQSSGPISTNYNVRINYY